jgi:thymidine kinase
MNTRWLNGKLVVDGPDVLIDGTSEIEYRSICPKCFYKYLKRDVKSQKGKY